MKFSENWLRTWVNPEIKTDELISTLTMAGLEVDGFENIGAELEGILVGLIEKTEQHPEADKLQVCSVNVGADENLQIICGAPNAREGLKVAVATIGCVLPGDFKIKKAKLRGVHSFGMLCSGKELQISDEHDGIMELAESAVIGEQLIDYLGMKDTAIDVDLTPNRGDCLGIKGIATEVGVLTQTPVTQVEVKPAEVTIDDKVEVNLTAPEANPRFVARVIKNVNINAETPEWMKARLLASDIRSIDAVVDVTNYVMLELGHPMHAFDLNNLNGAIEVRFAREGEKLTLLDDQEIELRTDTLVVADDEKNLSLAGIMGGKYTGINPDTKDLLLEAAHWDPVYIAGKARSYGLHTDASHRFERGVDYNLSAETIERATELLLEIVGGQAGPLVDEINQAHFPESRSVKLRRARIERLLGIKLEDEQIEDILTRLGMGLTSNEEGWLVEIPSRRFDISIEADLIEELVRIYGYNKVPSRKPVSEMSMIRQPENRLQRLQLTHALADRGYQEAITYTFVDKDSQQLIDPEVEPLALLNPISSELGVMRTSLWPGLLKSVEYNQKRQHDQVRLFETGLKFVPGEDGLVQTPVIAGVISGRRCAENWEAANEKVDFYDLKGDLEAIFKLTAASEQFTFVAAQRDGLHPGQTAEILRNGRNCGFIGKLHPQTQKEFDLDEAAYVFELDLKRVLARKIPDFSPLSKFPAIRRDLAILIKESVTSTQIVDLIGQTAKSWLNNIVIFDIYRGKGIEPGYKSVAIGFTLQRSDRTFKEAEINKTMERIISVLSDKLGAVLRE
ncbi:phenylalanine--tRNA ligase subunit beta [Aliikangiella coralliicola]|uniref:Phenylalanine--tRNA ligase beta subunit n=1 Tax=Aliikangiella coralliicola TaxID=2592383 RepID=A0A545TSQ2_9GAMM|nr:phenylalanine--tRNA ligase subunit beta [Aliikangiella coralliicola]TQV80242.1 phenylalanine--tRNA ligase subunit beta [Aliikangiella coralliicola]